MPALDIYVAAANIRDIPGKSINNMLTNVVDNFATDSLTNETNRMLQCANPINEMIDSGGYPLLKAEEKGKPEDKGKPDEKKDK